MKMKRKRSCRMPFGRGVLLLPLWRLQNLLRPQFKLVKRMTAAQRQGLLKAPRKLGLRRRIPMTMMKPAPLVKRHPQSLLVPLLRNHWLLSNPCIAPPMLLLKHLILPKQVPSLGSPSTSSFLSTSNRTPVVRRLAPFINPFRPLLGRTVVERVTLLMLCYLSLVTEQAR
uniref:Uncharacterized protein n=1 Tax=Cryptococcus bacillisporus CA1280 TaxID=1296109 RepID=A0A0D0VHS7_CRYGA|nr:hypothetical protein I312_03862 [Cryptococcus bacillisporus CA1280]